jgi:hypothetical protein
MAPALVVGFVSAFNRWSALGGVRIAWCYAGVNVGDLTLTSSNCKRSGKEVSDEETFDRAGKPLSG